MRGHDKQEDKHHHPKEAALLGMVFVEFQGWPNIFQLFPASAVRTASRTIQSQHHQRPRKAIPTSPTGHEGDCHQPRQGRKDNKAMDREDVGWKAADLIMETLLNSGVRASLVPS
ncbi:hypothetical protein AYX22_22885 (plasmid) [Arthrobacter sp. D5-1]|nr:hypothetical protein AYX22_22885 [Arthrobacter sp. D5-1]